MPLDLFLAGALRALIEVAAVALLGQGLLKQHLCGLHGLAC